MTFSMSIEITLKPYLSEWRNLKVCAHLADVHQGSFEVADGRKDVR